jgi:hypothetical protein
MTHTHSVGLLWTRNRPAAEASSCTRHSNHTRQTSMPLAGFKTAIPTSKRPQTHTFDRATIGIGNPWCNIQNICWRNSVIQFLRTYMSLVNSSAKSNNNLFQNFTALYHFRNTLHVGSVLSRLIMYTHLQHFSVFPCVVRPSENLRPWDIYASGHSTRPITMYNAFSNAFAAFRVNNQQASTCDRCGSCIHQEPHRNLAQRSITASLRPWSFRVQPRSRPGHFNSCISNASLPWHFAI